MPIPESPVHLRLTLPIAMAITILSGAWAALYTNEPHWLNRAGALVAAIAAGGILLQIRAEMRLEDQKDHLEELGRGTSHELSTMMPIEALKVKLVANRLGLLRTELSNQRLKVAGFVVAGAILGELLHGFGDLLMCFSFFVCGNH